MEEKSKKYITTAKKVIAIICGIIIIITGIYLYHSHNYKYNGDYYQIDCYGEIIDEHNPYTLINSYSEYVELLKKANNYGIEYKYDSNFFENNSLVFVDIVITDANSTNTELISLKEHNNSANIKIYINDCGAAGLTCHSLYFMPVSKKVTNANIKYVDDYTFEKENVIGAIIIFISIEALFITFRKKKENESTKKSILKILRIIIVTVAIIIIGLFILTVYNQAKEITSPSEKPIIYLYSKEDTEVSVKLRYSDNITVSYPKYTTGWNVLAKPDGNLVDLSTNRKLYSLYYESINVEKFKVEEDGFIVKGEDISTFLEEKLAILGLNERETEEFIIYWLPKLEYNEYNYIRFATIDEINKNMPLDINPNPDTIIRILMTYKGLNKPIEVKKQKLETPKREGFVAVEWGGTEIK